MIGQIIGGYKILEKIGEGGMGTVYRGMDILLERQVAIKSLRPELAHDQRLIERFRAEAVALARLNHPNIVMLYSFLPHNNQSFMVLEFVQGETLDKIIKRRGVMHWQQAIPLICQALDGLEQAHNLKVIHRDIKPANMALTPSGALKLMDFGIARILQTSRLTKTGHLFGTIEYMSPEQIQGKETDSRSDIYSLGIVLYEMLTGYIPFTRNSDFELLKAQVEELPPPPRSLTPQLPADLEKIVLRALAKAPEERFQNVAEFRTSLKKIITTTPILNGDQQISSVLPETRFDNTLPHSRSSLRASGAFSKAASTPQRDSLLTYIKRYPGIVASVLMIAGAATFIGIVNRSGTQAVLPASHPVQPASDSSTSITSIKPKSSNTSSPVFSEPKPDVGKPINPIPESASTTSNQGPAGATRKPVPTPTSQEQPAAAQPQESPLSPPNKAITETQPVSVQEPSQTVQQQQMTENSPEENSSVSTSPGQASIPSDRLSPSAAAPPASPSVPALKEPKPEKNERAVQPRQPALSTSASSSKKKSAVGSNKSSKKPRDRPSGRGGSGGWKIIY